MTEIVLGYISLCTFHFRLGTRVLSSFLYPQLGFGPSVLVALTLLRGGGILLVSFLTLVFFGGVSNLTIFLTLTSALH